VTHLACRGLTVTAGTRRILDDVDLDAPSGSVTALVGPSGAGKTTLLHAIAGLVPAEGSIMLDGAPIGDLPVHRRRIGLVFQEPRLFEHLTAAGNVAYPMRLRGVRRAVRASAARRLLDEVGLAGAYDQPATTLSGGEAQRVALARALAAAPRVLLLDEPFSAVDPERRASLRDLLLDTVRVRDLTTLIVTHDQAEACALGDRVLTLDRGRLTEAALHGAMA
jgi:thiamine transport system ATP-binding protein